MALNILRAEHSAQYPYVMMAKETANNHGLSLAARGLLAWLLDKPDSWEIDPDAIARLNKTSVYEVKKLLKELTTEGYLIPPQRQRVKGKFEYTPYTLRETPNLVIDFPSEPSVEIRVTETVERRPLNGDRTTEIEQRSHTGDKHEIAPAQITKINNNSNHSEQISTVITTAPVANSEPVAGVTGSRSSGVYAIPVLTGSDTWEFNAMTLPAEIEAATRRFDFKAKAPESKPPAQPKPANSDVSSAPPPVAPAPSPTDAELKFGRVAEYFEQKTGDLIPPRVSVLIQKSVDLYPEDWIKAAIDLAESKGKLFWEFVNGILFRWKIQGGMDTGRAKADAPTPGKPVDDFDPFVRDDEPDLPDTTEPEPVNEQWQRLGFHVENMNRELHRLYFSQCRFGRFEAGQLTILVPTQRIQTGCIWEMNHRGVFTGWCQAIWDGLTSVEFALEEAPDALPQSP